MKRFGTALLLVAALLTPVKANADDVVLRWNALAASLPTPNPFVQARVLAITQLAVFEAVNAITGEYEPYLGTVVATAGASADAAAIVAAHRVLLTYVPGSATTLDTARGTDLAAIPDGPAKEAGIATGEAAAAAMIAARANDGSGNVATYTPGEPVNGAWQLTTGCAAGVLLHWRGVTPFGIPNANDFMAGPPPALDSARYTKDYLEVKTVGSAGSTERPQDRADVARFYGASSPGYLFSLAARQMAVAQGRSMSHSAWALALMSMAINDSLVASFATKYEYNFWRPETAIRAGDSDGNGKTEGDTLFSTFVSTPCFPSYPSNHASGSNGASEVLRRIYGAGEHVITLSNPAVASIAGITLSYTTLKQICDDIDDARVYGGIHFRFDQEEGVRLGRDVATYVYKNNLRRVRGPE
jgi:hypothetical protein